MSNFTGNGTEPTASDSIQQHSQNQTLLLMIITISLEFLSQIFKYLWTWSTLWKVLSFILAIGNLKNLPLIWHLRIVNAFRFCLRSQRPKVKSGPDQIFQPIITESHAPLMEIDFNLHKTNSSYFSDVDVARTHLFCTLFSEGIEQMRGGTQAVTGSKEPVFGIALGAVSCNFKKELKPYESYEMWTRILSWDEKWIWVVTHFVRKDTSKPKSYTLYPHQKEKLRDEKCKEFDPKSSIVASSLSKCVFKQGRKTISPEFMLNASGLLPDALLQKKLDAQLKEGITAENEQEWTYEKINEERLRGKKIADTLSAESQSDLEQSFTGESEALGRHTDGTGMIGVFSTLAQLAGLKKHQIL